jgi:NDP-sugar pyrophosphorylase family protein
MNRMPTRSKPSSQQSTAKAVILVGGMGTRLRPLTFSIPKPLLPVGEKPILQLIIEQLRESGIRELILATGYQAELIQAFCGDGSKLGVGISYVKEPGALGTAGPLSLVKSRIREGEFFLLMNGDILTKLNFRSFVEHARAQDCDLLVGYTKQIYRSPFGVLSISNGKIAGIVEKPSQEFPISAGIYCVKSSALPFVPDGKFFTVPDLVNRLLESGKKVGAYHIRESWVGLESTEHFEEAVKELQNAPTWKRGRSGDDSSE